MSAPISMSESSRPTRRGFIISPSMVTSDPGTISAATSAKAAEEGSAGTITGRARRVGRPSSTILRPCSPWGSLVICAPK